MKMTIALLCLLGVADIAEPSSQNASAKRIHVIVALCDNQHQGIVKVGAKIGNGDDLNGNLYWGCDDGLWRWLAASNRWTLIESERADPKTGESDPWAGVKVLETQRWKHRETGAILVAEAWRGREIQAATQRFVDLLSEETPGASPDLVAWIGHNGLMDFRFFYDPTIKAAKPRDAIVLCCLSRSYFSGIFEDRGVRPVLLTEQLMYPGAFLLDAALEGWLKGEGRPAIRERAASAYAKNQKISQKAALGVFSDLK